MSELFTFPHIVAILCIYVLSIMFEVRAKRRR